VNGKGRARIGRTAFAGFEKRNVSIQHPADFLYFAGETLKRFVIQVIQTLGKRYMA